jgi:hypothetical protein
MILIRGLSQSRICTHIELIGERTCGQGSGQKIPAFHHGFTSKFALPWRERHVALVASGEALPCEE